MEAVTLSLIYILTGILCGRRFYFHFKMFAPSLLLLFSKYVRMSTIPTIDSRNAAYSSFEDLQEAVKSYGKIHNFCFKRSVSTKTKVELLLGLKKYVCFLSPDRP